MASQMAELHYASEPTVDVAVISERVEALVHSGVEVPKPTVGGSTLLFFHTNHVHQSSDGSAPAQTAILASNGSPEIVQYQEDVQQSWSCSDALDHLKASKTTRLVSEMASQAFTPTERISLFHGVLQAYAEFTKPHAIVFKHSQQVVSADAYLDSCRDSPILRPGALNVRFYNISNSDGGDMVMDTRGLEELGLHDLQCHFRSLDPNGVSRLLFNTAVYIFENGPVIESGQTVEGTEPGSTWKCQFEESLVEPKREVLDLNPGHPYAAGGR